MLVLWAAAGQDWRLCGTPPHYVHPEDPPAAMSCQVIAGDVLVDPPSFVPPGSRPTLSPAPFLSKGKLKEQGP